MRSIKHADFSLLLLASISSNAVGLTRFAAAPSASWTRAAPVSRAAVTTSRENFFSNDPRAGVLTRLFGTQAAKVKFLRAGYGERKEAVLRWRVAQFRSMVDRTSREIEALQENAAQQRDEVEANAIHERMSRKSLAMGLGTMATLKRIEVCARVRHSRQCVAVASGSDSRLSHRLPY